MDLRRGSLKHFFLVMHECPYPLIRQGLLHNLKAQIYFKGTNPLVTLKFYRKTRDLQKARSEVATTPPSVIVFTCPLTEGYLFLADSLLADFPPTLLLQKRQKEIPGV